MDKLITFIDLCVRSAKTTSDRSTRQKYFEQAFGAVQYHGFVFPTDYDEVESLWNDKYRHLFEELVYSLPTGYFKKAENL